MVYADDILEKPAKADTKTTLTDAAKGTVTGSVLGLIGGTLYAFFQKKKYMPCMLIGTVIGGAVSAAFLIKK